MTGLYLKAIVIWLKLLGLYVVYVGVLLLPLALWSFVIGYNLCNM